MYIVSGGKLNSTLWRGFDLAQVPSGWLADRFGGMWLLAGSMVVESALAMLIPAAAHLHVGAVIALRSLAGVVDGIQCPTVISLVAGISPPTDRSRVVGFTMSGTSFGAIVGMLVAGYLCDRAGWPSVFYVFGLTGCVWAAAWVVVGRGYGLSTPRSRQSTAAAAAVHRRTPWREILTSKSVWACALAYTANMWGFVTSLTCLPMYLSDVFGAGMTENGLLSMLPYIADGLLLVSSGHLSDLLLRSRLSKGVVRKSFCVFGLVMSAVFIMLVGGLGCQRIPIIACLVASVGMIGVSMPNVAANTMDLSPSDAGTLMGLANSISNAVSILAPQVRERALSPVAVPSPVERTSDSSFLYTSFIHPKRQQTQKQREKAEHMQIATTYMVSGNSSVRT